MDMEELSKSQIVLLTLLVSFVTSIATGIVTVSLMDQAPPAIAQTVNRIVERTVEKVVPGSQAAASVVTQEKTIIVKESDLISKAVARVGPSIVRIYSNAAENPTFLGLGIVADGSGTIVSDSVVLGETVSAVVELSDKTRVQVFVASSDPVTGIEYFSAATTTTEGKPVVWTPIAMTSGSPVLGETVVTLSGKSVSRIAAGLVTTLVPLAEGSLLQVVDTDIPADSILPGSALFNTDGSLLGLSTSAGRLASPSGFVSAVALMKSEDKPEEKKTP